MGFGIMSIVHAVLALMLIIELGLTANLVSKTRTFFGNDAPSQFAFMLFNTIWSLIVLFYLGVIPLIFGALYHGLVALVLMVITTIFWFAGSIAMADYIGVPDCRGNNICQSAQAAVAFGFFIWVIFTGMTVMEGLSFSKGGARVDGSRKPGGPVSGV